MRTKHEILLAEERGEKLATFLVQEDDAPWYIPETTKALVLQRGSERCAICGKQHDLEIDHIIPVTRGGLASLSNLQVLCSWCNRAKSNHYLHRESYTKGYPVVIADNEQTINRRVL